MKQFIIKTILSNKIDQRIIDVSNAALNQIIRGRVSPCGHIKQPDLKPKRKPRPNQAQEWLGDAILRMYARIYLLEKYPDEKIKSLIRVEHVLQTNRFLQRFAQHRRIQGNANVIEVMVCQKYEQSPQLAREFAYQIFDFYGSENIKSLLEMY